MLFHLLLGLVNLPRGVDAPMQVPPPIMSNSLSIIPDMWTALAVIPSKELAVIPSSEVAVIPTIIPTIVPTVVPTVIPTVNPTVIPTVNPTVVPTVNPTVVPTVNPIVNRTVTQTTQTVTQTAIETAELFDLYFRNPVVFNWAFTVPKFYFIIPILLLSFAFGLMLVLYGARAAQQEASKVGEEQKLYDIDDVLLLMQLASIIGHCNPGSPQSQAALSGSGLLPFFGAAEYIEPIELFRRSSTVLPSAPSLLFGSAEYIKPIQLFRRSSTVSPSRVELSSGNCLAPSGPPSQVASCVSIELSSGCSSAPTEAPHIEMLLPSPHADPLFSFELSSACFSASTEAPHIEMLLPSPHVDPLVSFERSSGCTSAPTEAPHIEMLLPSPHISQLVSVKRSLVRYSPPLSHRYLLPSRLMEVISIASVVQPLNNYLHSDYQSVQERSLVLYSPPLSHRYLLLSRLMEVISIASVVQPLNNYLHSDYQSVQERSLVLYSPPLSHRYLLLSKLMEIISITSEVQPLNNYQKSNYQSVQERSLVLYSPPLSHRYLSAPVTIVSVDESFFRYLPTSFDFHFIHYQELDFGHPIYLPFLPPSYGELYPKGIKKIRQGTRGGQFVQMRRFNTGVTDICLWLLCLEKPTELLNWLQEFSLLDEEEFEWPQQNSAQEPDFGKPNNINLKFPQRTGPDYDGPLALEDLDMILIEYPQVQSVQESDGHPSIINFPEERPVEIMQPVRKSTEVNKQSGKYKEKLDATSSNVATSDVETISNDTTTHTTPNTTTTEQPIVSTNHNERSAPPHTTSDVETISNDTTTHTTLNTTTTEQPIISTNHNERSAPSHTTYNDRRNPRTNNNDRRPNYTSNRRGKRKMTLQELNESMGL